MTAVKIAMWSGPRNISTAMMLAFENRPDTTVTDEPFYAHYLIKTGIDHPGREAVLAVQENDWRKVVRHLTGPIPDRNPVWYQKQMAQHIFRGRDLSWIGKMTNCFLIRDPREVILSYQEKFNQVKIEWLGFRQQADLFDRIAKINGKIPPVLDARDVLENPRKLLKFLCKKVGIEFLDCMLCWPRGQRDSDGIWAKYWYQSVVESTGFNVYKPKQEKLPADLIPVYEECLPHYRLLYENRLK